MIPIWKRHSWVFEKDKIIFVAAVRRSVMRGVQDKEALSWDVNVKWRCQSPFSSFYNKLYACLLHLRLFILFFYSILLGPIMLMCLSAYSALQMQPTTITHHHCFWHALSHFCFFAFFFYSLSLTKGKKEESIFISQKKKEHINYSIVFSLYIYWNLYL